MKYQSSMMVAMLLFIAIVNSAKSQTLVAKEVNNSIVQPINWSRFKEKAPHDKLANTVKATLLNANKFALTAWYHEVKKYQVDSTGYLDLKSKSKVNEYRYRFPA